MVDFFFFFFFFRLSQLLYPTLVAACYQMEENMVILEEEISSKLLITFLQEACRTKQEEKGQKDGKTTGKASCTTIVDLSSMLQHRFPKAHWEQAIAYFSK